MTVAEPGPLSPIHFCPHHMLLAKPRSRNLHLIHQGEKWAGEVMLNGLFQVQAYP